MIRRCEACNRFTATWDRVARCWRCICGWRFVVALLAGLVAGCAPSADLIRALAADPASVCIHAKALLYGEITIIRSNAEGAALVACKPDDMAIQHRGK